MVHHCISSGFAASCGDGHSLHRSWSWTQRCANSVELAAHDPAAATGGGIAVLFDAWMAEELGLFWGEEDVFGTFELVGCAAFSLRKHPASSGCRFLCRSASCCFYQVDAQYLLYCWTVSWRSRGCRGLEHLGYSLFRAPAPWNIQPYSLFSSCQAFALFHELIAMHQPMCECYSLAKSLWTYFDSGNRSFARCERQPSRTYFLVAFCFLAPGQPNRHPTRTGRFRGLSSWGGQC